MNSRKILVIFSIAAFCFAGSALADSKTWTIGNFQYKKVGNGVQVTQINSPAKTKIKSKTKFKNNNAAQSAQQFLDIASVDIVGDINVAFGTDASALNLPDKISVTMADGSAQDVPVLWDNGTPAYDSNTPGTYVFFGMPVVSGDITNTQSIKTSVNVVVGDLPQAQPPAVVQPIVPPVSPDNSISQTASPSDDDSLLQTTSPATEDVIQNAASGLLNGVDSLFKIILSPLKFIPFLNKIF